MKFRRFSLFLLLRPNFVLSRCLYNTKRVRGRVLTKSPTDLAFPPHFEEKIRNWNKLIELELKARSANDQKDGILSKISTLQIVSVKRNVSGNVAYLKLPELSDKSDEKISRAISMLSSGTPVTIKKIVEEQESSESLEETNGNNNVHKNSNNNRTIMKMRKSDGAKEAVVANEYKGIILGVEDEKGLLTVKLTGIYNDNDLPKPSEEDAYRLNAEREFQFYENLQDLFSKRRSWSSYAGYKLLLYTYRARQMPTAFSDRRITLPKEFNEEQCAAISAALNSQRPITAIQGPPGTGKTKVIGQIIAECIHNRRKVLVCAPSHKALENIMDVCRRKGLDRYCKLHGEDEKGDRYFKNLIQDHSYYSMLNGCYEELNNSEELNNNSTENQKLRKLAILRTNSIERKIQMDIATDTQILLCTLSSSSVRKLFDLGFSPDLTIIDEAGQAMEIETWPMLFQAPRAVIVGDHKQLSPMVFSEKAKEERLDVSLIESLAKEHGKKLLFTLREQYRSNSLVQRWSSNEFYEGLLTAHRSCADIHLRDLLDFNDASCNNARAPIQQEIGVPSMSPLIDDPLVLVDTDLVEEDLKLFINDKSFNQKTYKAAMFKEKSFNHSLFNRGEARVCAKQLLRLIVDMNIDPRLVGCITPYAAQTKEIKKHLPKILRDHVDVSSVDAFQGQEREVIVMSFVRNNDWNVIGFLNDERRMNVAVTRAKRQFFLVASSRMMRVTAEIGRLYETIRETGRIVSPAEIFYPSEVRRARENAARYTSSRSISGDKHFDRNAAEHRHTLKKLEDQIDAFKNAEHALRKII